MHLCLALQINQQGEFMNHSWGQTSGRQDSEPTSIIVLNSPELRPQRNRQLVGETQNLAFGLQLLLDRGFTKVVSKKITCMTRHCPHQGKDSIRTLFLLLAPQDRSFRKQCRNSTNGGGHSKLQNCEMLGSQICRDSDQITTMEEVLITYHPQ